LVISIALTLSFMRVVSGSFVIVASLAKSYFITFFVSSMTFDSSFPLSVNVVEMLMVESQITE